MKKLYYSPVTGIIPLAILIGYAINLCFIVATTNIKFQAQHYGGLTLVVANIIAFFIYYKLGILTTGLTVICGLIGLIAFTPSISITSFMFVKTTFLRFQPFFIWWTLLHFLLSFRYYIGVAREAYWKNIANKDWLWPKD